MYDFSNGIMTTLCGKAVLETCEMYDLSNTGEHFTDVPLFW